MTLQRRLTPFLTKPRKALSRGVKGLKTGGFKKRTTLTLKKRATGQIEGNKRKVKPSRSLSKLKKDLDCIFSRYIRQKYANADGMVKCYTCEKVKHWKEMQNGHFISRQYLITRFDENNVRPQETGCNIFAHGKPLDFEENLKRELGHDFVEQMKASRHQIVKLDRAWYMERINFYKSKVTEMEI